MTDKLFAALMEYIISNAYYEGRFDKKADAKNCEALKMFNHLKKSKFPELDLESQEIPF